MTFWRDSDVQRPGFAVLGIIALALQAVLLRHGLSNREWLETAFSGGGLLLSGVIGVLIALRRILVPQVLLAALGVLSAWFALLLYGGVTHSQVDMGLYMTQLLLMTVACLRLPFGRAVTAAVLSSGAMLLVVLTRPSVNWPLLLMVLLLGALIGFLSFHGEQVRERVAALHGEGLRDAQTGLLKRQGVLFALRDLLHHRPASVQGLYILLVSVDGYRSLAEIQRGQPTARLVQHCAAALRAELRPDEFASLWEDRAFLLTVRGDTPAAALARADELRTTIERAASEIGPSLVRSGMAALRQGDELEQGIAEASAQLFVAKQRGAESTLLEGHPAGSEKG